MIAIYNPSNPSEIIPMIVEDDRWFITHKWNGVDELEFELRSNDPNCKYAQEEALVLVNDEGGNLFVVKNVDEHSDFITVTCELCLDEWKKSFWKAYKKTNATLLQVLTDIMPAGWSQTNAGAITTRTHICYEDGAPYELMTAVDILEQAASAFGCVFNFDVPKKIIKVVVPSKNVASGKFLSDELNLKKIGFVGNSSAYRTRLYAFGKIDEETGEALTFESINGGKAYVEDFTYSNKIISVGWSDERYTVKENLLEDAKKKLAELAKPTRSYSCDMVNFEKDVSMYQIVMLIDRKRKQSIDHQVVEYKRYPKRHDLDVVTLSSVEPNIGSMFNKIQDAIAKKAANVSVDIQAVIDEAIDHATKLITGNLGGHFVWVFDDEGKPIELLNLGDSDDPSKAKKVWRWNASGLGHSNNGVAGPYDLALLADGSINASMMTTGILNGGIIRAGIIQDVLGRNSWDLENGIFKFSAGSQIGNSMTVGELISNVESVDGEVTALSSDLTLTKQSMTANFKSVNEKITSLESGAATTNTNVAALQATYATCSTGASVADKVAALNGFVLRKGATVSVKFSYANSVANPTLNVNGTGAKPIYLNNAAIPQDAWWKANQVLTFVYSGSQWVLADGSVAAQTLTNKTDISSLKITAQEISTSVQSNTTSITQLKATYATCSTAAGTAAKIATCASFSLRVGALVSVKFTYANNIANPTLNVNGTGAKAIRLNNVALPKDCWWKAGDLVTFVYDGTYWCLVDGATLSQLTSTREEVSSLKQTSSEISASVSTLSTDMGTAKTNISALQATYAVCSTAAATAAKVASLSNFKLTTGAQVSVRFTYSNTAANPTLNVNNTGAKAIYLNGSALPQDAWWLAGQVLTFVYNGSQWVLIDGSTAAQSVTNKKDIANLVIKSDSIQASVNSHTTTLDQLKASYGTSSTAAATQVKVVNCSNFALRTGALICVKFTYANTATNPKLNVNGTGDKYIYKNGTKALSEKEYWKANDVVTFVYDGVGYQLADGSTVERLTSTENSVASLVIKSDSIESSVKALKASYAYCSTAASTQIKEVTLNDFQKFTGATLAVRFYYANTASNPKLRVNNSSGTVIAEGYIYVNGSYMTQKYYWAANGVVTFVWNGSAWEVGDGATESRIVQLANSISLSVSNATLGSEASIVLSVDGATASTAKVDLKKNARKTFANDTSAVTISAGVVTFNSNTFVVNSSYFKVASDGAITASKGTIAGWTIGSNSLYKDRTALTGTTPGVFLGNSGLSTSNGYVWNTMAEGALYGGYSKTYKGSASETGYVSFYGYYTATGVAGTRVAGKGYIALYTPYLGVGAWTTRGNEGTFTVGVSKSSTYLKSLSIGWHELQRMAQCYSNSFDIGAAITFKYPNNFSWTTGTVSSTKGLVTGLS